MPVSSHDWVYPLLRLAGEHVEAAYQLSPTRTPASYCILLQMAFEKTAKAIYARSGTMFTRNHRFIAMLFQGIARMTDRTVASQATGDLLEFLREIELSNSSIAKSAGVQANMDYPWEDPATGLLSEPLSDLPVIRRLQNPKYTTPARALRFAAALNRHYSALPP